MTYLLIGFIIIVGIIFGFFFRNKFYDLNTRLFSYLQSSNFTVRLNTSEASFSVTGAWSWQFYKLYSDEKSIILIDPYDLDLNRNSKLYAKTYLITTKKQLKNYPVDLFKNILIVETFEFNSDLILKGKLKNQLIFKEPTWTTSNNVKLKIKKPNQNFDFRKIIQSD